MCCLTNFNWIWKFALHQQEPGKLTKLVLFQVVLNKSKQDWKKDCSRDYFNVEVITLTRT